MKAIRGFIGNSVLAVSLAIIGIVAMMVVLAYVWSVAGHVIDQTVLSLATVLGYGSVAVAVAGMVAGLLIIGSGTFEFVGNRIFGYLVTKAETNNKLLKSEYDLQVLEQGQTGFLLSRPHANVAGRPLHLESSGFMAGPEAQYDTNVSLAKFHLLNSPVKTSPGVDNAVPLLESPSTLNFETITKNALMTRDCGRFIAFGSQGSGKTTLVKHFISYAIETVVGVGGDVFVIDPHAPSVVWPTHPKVKIVGAGLDYASVKNFLLWLIQEKKERYEAGCGDDSQPLPEPYKPLVVVCEEWNGIVDKLVKDDIWPDVTQLLYRDARKAGIGFMLITHEHTVGALGLSGKGNLLSGVEYFVTLQKDRVNNTYSANMGSSFKDKEPYTLTTPGPYNGRMYYSKEQAISERQKTDKYLVIDAPKDSYSLDLSGLSEPEAAGPNDDEKQAIEAYVSLRDDNPFYWKAATQAAFGDGRYGKNYTNKLKRILDKFDVDYSQHIVK